MIGAGQSRPVLFLEMEPMTKIQYLRLLHDIAYQANLADTSSADAWQTPDMAATHCQPVLDIACSMLTPAQYQAFLDCFGDFASFAALLEGADA
jgi:hypothetical protein